MTTESRLTTDSSMVAHNPAPHAAAPMAPAPGSTGIATVYLGARSLAEVSTPDGRQQVSTLHDAGSNPAERATPCCDNGRKIADALRADLARVTREREEWHGRASESARLRRELDEARLALTASEKDAARYRWLREMRDDDSIGTFLWTVVDEEAEEAADQRSGEPLYYDALDDAIDARLAKGETK